MNFGALAILALGVHHAKPVNPDSLRREVAYLSGQGDLDSALAVVEKASPSLPPTTANLLRGKLELRGEASRKAFEVAAKDSSANSPRGEALFRLGQFYYAGGHYHLAIPQFREYLSHFPKGSAANAAMYWMAHACLQLAQQQPARKSYLDTGLRYLERLESKSRPKGYYLPLALNAKARLLIARGNPGDTTLALTALEESRRRAPVEEIPGTLLLSARASQLSSADTAHKFEDSVLWDYPSSLEASLLTTPAPLPKHISAAKPVRDSTATHPSTRYTLQLGSFSVSQNAEEMRKSLAAKGIRVWVEQTTGENRMFRVLAGIYPDSAAARNEGLRLFKPLSYPFQVLSLRP